MERWKYQNDKNDEKKKVRMAQYGPMYNLYCVRRVWRYQMSIRLYKSKKDRQHNGQKKKDKRSNNDL